MKTLKQIIDDVAREEFPEYVGLTDGIHHYFAIAVAKRAAESALDTAIELSHDFVVDTEDLIKLKDQLK